MTERVNCISERKIPHMPLFLDLTERVVVIFGAGSVGERKAELFSCYSLVRVISLDFTPRLHELAEQPGSRIDLIQCDISCGFEEHLEGAFLAVPATSDSGLNRAIEERARSSGILVNRVEGAGEVVVPSILHRGSIAIAISTGVPALTRYLRLRLEAVLTDSLIQMSRLLEEIRSENRQLVPEQRERARILWRILRDEEVWRQLDISYEKAYMRARSIVRADERDCLDAGDSQKGLH